MAIPGKVGGIKFEEEYKKKTLISPSDIEKLREWMLTQPHLPAEHITDLDLILAYHCCDRSTGVTKTVLDLHFTIKTLFTNIFKDRAVDEKVIYTCKTKCFLPLEVHARDDSAVIYCSLIDPDYKTFVFSEAVKSVLMVLDLWQYQAGTWPGFVILIDLSQLSLGHLGKLDLQTIQQFLYYLQETVLLKLKGLHFLNAPSFMDKLMMLLKPFLKKELLDVLHIHQVGSKTLDRFVPMEGLPKEAGGDFKTYKQASVVIVTGASSGIGAAAAIMFCREGANVALVARNEKKLMDISNKCSAAGGKHVIIKADVSNDDDAKRIISETVAKFGQLDVLVNNAGITGFCSVLGGTVLETYDKIMKINLRAVVHLTMLAAPQLVKTKGNIVNISSIAGSIVADPSASAYCCSKAGLNHFTQSTAAELAPSGVRVNAISPGPVVTDIYDNAGVTPDVISAIQTPLGRVSQAEEIADLILYLASDKSKGITGSNIVSDNGCMLHVLK